MDTSLFDPAKNSLKWGREALAEFNDICDSFFDISTYEEVPDIDPKTGDVLIKLKPRRTFEINCAARKATEAILNIKNAFDQAAHAVVVTKAPRFTGSTSYFPWTDTPDGLERRLVGKSCKIPESLWATFRELEPYGTGDGHTGGDDFSRNLAKIANRKHTVGIVVAPEVHRTNITVSDISGVGGIKSQHPKWNSVTNEIEVMRISKDCKVNYNCAIYLDVFFDKTTPLERISVSMAVSVFVAKANNAIEALQAQAAIN